MSPDSAQAPVCSNFDLEQQAREYAYESKRVQNRLSSLNGEMRASFWETNAHLDRVDRTLDKIVDAQEKVAEILAELVSRREPGGPG